MADEPTAPPSARALIIDGLRAAITGAAEAATKAQVSAAESIAAYRLSVRRARAVLKLVGDELGRRDRRRARDLFRAAAAEAEGEHAVPVALAALAGWSLAPPLRINADAVIESTRAAVGPDDDLGAALTEAVAQITAADPASALDDALPADLELEALIRSVADSFREARDAAHGAHHSPRRFRRWHRRCMDLAFQLELIAGGAGRHTQTLADEYAALARDLGTCADLLDARDLVKAGPGSTGELRQLMRDSLDDQMRALRVRARDLLGGGGKAFARRLRTALEVDRTGEDGEAEDSAGDAHAGGEAPAPAHDD